MLGCQETDLVDGDLSTIVREKVESSARERLEKRVAQRRFNVGGCQKRMSAKELSELNR